MVFRKQRLIRLLYALTSLTALCILVISVYTIIQSAENTVKDIQIIAFSNSLIILAILPIPYFIFKRLGYVMPKMLHIYHITFVWLSLILGEIVGIYRVTTFYDALIHILGGYLIALIGVYLINTILSKPSQPFIYLFVCSFTQGIAVIWELFEYGVDFTFGSNMQSYFDDMNQVMFVGQQALTDTMQDLLLNIVGMFICLATYKLYKNELKFMKEKGLTAKVQ